MSISFILASFTTFIIALAMYPAVIQFCIKKNFCDHTGPRKIHTAATPVLGGAVIIVSTILSFLIWSSDYFYPELLSYFAAIIILTVAGIKDDLHFLKPAYKFFAQVLASFVLVLPPKFRITGMHGLFGIYQLPDVFCIVITMLVILTLINAWNFIDGMDGLATVLALISILFASIFFAVQSELLMFTLCICLGSALLVFIIYNKSPARIFMGDTGSMFIGLTFSVFSILIFEDLKSATLFFANSTSVSLFVVALSFIPAVDLIFVFIIRILQGKSPFIADVQHVHHQLMQCNISQNKVLIILAGFQFMILALAFCYYPLRPDLFLMILFIIVFGLRWALNKTVRKKLQSQDMANN